MTLVHALLLALNNTLARADGRTPHGTARQVLDYLAAIEQERDR